MTTWQRLEATTIDAALVEGPEARIADAMWMLGRQWQVGEFTGEDAGSPLYLEAVIEHAPITRVRLGEPNSTAPVIEREALSLPLEVAVEREAVRTGPAAVRVAAEAGLELRREFDVRGVLATVVDGVREAFALVLEPDDGLDPVGRSELELLARRAPDARAVFDDHQHGGPVMAGVPGTSAAAARAAIEAWAAWYEGWCSEPDERSEPWDPQRMEYRFQIAAGVGPDQEVQLDATEYVGGHLDWYSFDRAAEGVPDTGARGPLDTHPVRVLPTPARFAGQAASRWWQVEDGAVWFGDIGSAPEDLARVAVAGFGMAFGDNWYLGPCRLPGGVIARAAAVRVYDVFGEAHPIRSCAELDGPGRHWRFFELTGDDSADAEALKDRRCPWLLLSPALAGVTQSAPIEEVAFLRDEVANLGWAAELRIESVAGRTIDRAALARAAMTPPQRPAGSAWGYQLATPVPEHQIPLVPVYKDGGLFLQRGRMADQNGDGAARGALGRVLEPESQLLIFDDEVPVTGVRVTRSWQMARTGAGGAVVWVGRRKDAGPPRRSPGLRFDDLSVPSQQVRPPAGPQ
jgi:hypothetical protein